MSNIKDYIEALPQDMHDALLDFDTHCESISKTLVNKLNSTVLPPLVYHYTDYAGLQGIMQSGKLWLSDIYSMNDPTELKHGFRFPHDLVNKAIDKNRPAHMRFYNEYVKWDTIDGLESVADAFACSFSIEGDDLGQWRAYADDGRGYALGFDRFALEAQFQEELKGDDKHSFLVIYDDNSLLSLQSEMFSNTQQLLELLWKADDPAVYREYKSCLIRLFDFYSVLLGLIFKNESYRDEKEFRLLVLRGPQDALPTKLRTRPHELIRYIEFGWKNAKTVLKEIVIGPAAPTEKSLKFVKACQRAYLSGNEDIRISRSPIPYRQPLPRG